MSHKQKIEQLLPFVGTVSGKSGMKAILDMARNLAVALAEAGVEVDEYQNAYRRDEIFNPLCLLGNHENIFEFVSPNYRGFCEIMLQLRPIGMGTPNAMVGEGEFMALFCSPRVTLSKRKAHGDIVVAGKAIELKGSQIRIMGSVRGIEVQQHAKKIASKHEVTPNRCSGNRTAYEPWDKNGARHKVRHWVQQFNRLGTDLSCDYLSELCGVFMQCSRVDFARCFDADGLFDALCLQRIILKKLFYAMDKEWDAFTVIDGNQIKCLPNDVEKFNALVDCGVVTVTANYFRSFQNTNIGLYIATWIQLASAISPS